MRRCNWECCLWLLSVTYTITRLHPVIKATLLFLGHFLHLLLFILILLLLSSHPRFQSPLAVYFRGIIIKSSDYSWDRCVHMCSYAHTQYFSNKLNVATHKWRHSCTDICTQANKKILYISASVLRQFLSQFTESCVCVQKAHKHKNSVKI